MEEEVLLTEQLYKKIMDDKVSELMKLKQSQGETINRITVEKEVLKELRNKLKQTKKDIKQSKKNLNKSQSDLSRINQNLRSQYDNIKVLSDEFIGEEESYIDLNYFNQEAKKR